MFWKSFELAQKLQSSTFKQNKSKDNKSQLQERKKRNKKEKKRKKERKKEREQKLIKITEQWNENGIRKTV